MAAEILCSRWTLLVLREIMCGSTRFNEIRRGVPRMSPALLSKRLKELEAAGIIVRSEVPGERGSFDYRMTQAGQELSPIIDAIGRWGHTWIETEASLKNLDPQLLMWDIRRNINPDPMPKCRSTIQFIYTDLPVEWRNWWLIADPNGEVDLCYQDPGFDVDLFIATDLRTMTQVWMGYIPMAQARANGKLTLTGRSELRDTVQAWFKLSTVAKLERRVA
jgi:DNA-binding HxlR family transcriptional regulator